MSPALEAPHAARRIAGCASHHPSGSWSSAQGATLQLFACSQSCRAFTLLSSVQLQASLEEMIAPGALVILTPIVVGVLFGTRTLAGVLSGALVSGVQMAVSMSNTGGAWDNAKKYVEVRRTGSCACCSRRRIISSVVVPIADKWSGASRCTCSMHMSQCRFSAQISVPVEEGLAKAESIFHVQAGASEHARTLGGKGSDCHHAAVIGDTVSSQILWHP